MVDIADSSSLALAGRKVLVATNQFFQISGSEVVALEVVEHFSRLGCHVTFYANLIGPALAAACFDSLEHVSVVQEPCDIRPFTFDIVYAQHQVLGLFNYAPSNDDRARTSVITGRLSRKGYLESGGWLHEKILGDHVLANSELTAEHLVAVGQPGPITNFRNAAPESFFKSPRDSTRKLKRALVVTNHGDVALLQAVDILRQTIDVDHVGRSGSEVRRITPELLAGADVVISIGKTIPYALVGRVPVYVYDHFGGPGYLDETSFDLAARFNFTGRCCGRKLTADEIASEVLNAFDNGATFAAEMPQDWLDRFYLPNYLDIFLRPSLLTNLEKRQKMQESPILVQEAMLAEYVRKTFRDAHWKRGRIKSLEKKVAELLSR